ncbi:MAG: class I SAM-dependent methyltransferase [Bacteroidetes bacterium]|nr:class I SAM-dependent methyltransferase [Bacteroidota bacterium]
MQRINRKRLLLEAIKGDEVECPCCKGRYLVFMPFGIAARRDAHAQCPNCATLPRHRLMWMFLMERTQLLKKPMRVLHIAPEKFFFETFSKHPLVRYVAGDKFAPGYHYAKGTIDLDVTQLDFPEASFDALICSHVLEHVPDDALGMRELFRVLAPGGFAIIQVPLNKRLSVTDEDVTITNPQERERRFGQHDHFRIYGLDLKERLRSAGFMVEVVPYTGQFSYAERFRFGLPTDEDIYYCSKPALSAPTP